MFEFIKQCSEERWRRFEKKIFRECTGFATHQDWHTFIMYDREEAMPELIAFLANPENIFTSDNVIVLKKGRSSTVIKVKLDGRDRVIKRYNIKDVWHRIRRAMRQTRARSAWRLAQKLRLFGVATAKPIAFIENRFLGFKGTSYLVTEYVSGVHVGDYLSHVELNIEKTPNMIKRVTTLLKSLSKLEMTHGDLKISNLLVDKHAQPVFIDLDGAEEHASFAALQAEWQKEIARLLENFRDNPNLLEKFRIELESD